MTNHELEWIAAALIEGQIGMKILLRVPINDAGETVPQSR